MLGIGEVDLQFFVYLKMEALLVQPGQRLEKQFKESVVKVGVIPFLDHVGEQFLLELH